MQPTKVITLRGVRVHNLKSIDVDIPLHRLTVVTGVAGSGKSSLVFDTLYAEAQRRYLQSLSACSGQFLERLDRPESEIGDLPPALAIRRTARKASKRATVGSLTGIAECLAVRYVRAGVVVCPGCGQRVAAHRTADVVAAVQAMPAGTRCTIAFPVMVPPLTDQPGWQASLLEQGYVRLQVGGAAHRLGEQTAPTFSEGETAWVLLDRVEAGKTPVERLTESVDTAFHRGDGRAGVLTDAGASVYDQRFICRGCERVFTAPEPRLFDPDGCEGPWNADALAVQVDGRSIADWYAQPLVELLPWLDGCGDSAADPIRERLQALTSLDLGYLTLQQPAGTLTDGAARRIALATALASNLVHVLYLIDEPSTGLHPRDTAKLIDALHRLCERGNTVVVVEHERDIVAAADHVIDLGPGAGEEGGSVVYQGPAAGLAGCDVIEIPARRRQPTGRLHLTGACVHNLRDLSVEFPLGVLCAVTGVGGAGKRSLVEHSLYPALCAAKKKKADATTAKVNGAQHINDVILLDQEPLARSARSNPATYLKIFDDIRDLFAATVDAKIRNFGPGHFSFNQAGGRCETCEGQGSMTIDMQFLADVTTICPECQGRRYCKEILDIKVRSRNIAEVLNLTIREAFRFFHAQPAIEKKLKVLLDVGLEYLRLGQAVETVAGGECQRLRLAGQLATTRKTGCLFLLIEPTAGLHPRDVANLLGCFDRLLSAGHSLIVIEHDLDVIASADWVIDLDAGRIVAQGTPEEIARVAESQTGRILLKTLKKK